MPLSLGKSGGAGTVAADSNSETDTVGGEAPGVAVVRVLIV